MERKKLPSTISFSDFYNLNVEKYQDLNLTSCMCFFLSIFSTFTPKIHVNLLFYNCKRAFYFSRQGSRPVTSPSTQNAQPKFQNCLVKIKLTNYIICTCLYCTLFFPFLLCLYLTCKAKVAHLNTSTEFIYMEPVPNKCRVGTWFKFIHMHYKMSEQRTVR